MAWILRDYYCAACDSSFEDMTQSGGSSDAACPACSRLCASTLSAPKPAVYSMLSKDDQAKSLRKRSRDHTKKLLKQDPTNIKMSRHVTGKK